MSADLVQLTKAEAAAAGLKKFFSGKPCRYGHFGLSWVKEGGCCVCWSARMKTYRQQNREHLAQRDAERYRAQRPQRLDRARQARDADPVKARAISRAHYSRNKAKHLTYSANRRAAKLQATPPWVSKREILDFYEKAAQLTRTTGVTHHVDHIIPLQGCCVRGLHVPWNLQLLTEIENRTKRNRWGCPNCEVA